MSTALRLHWPEYLIEAALLGAFMVSATGFAVLLFHPALGGSHALDPFLRRLLMGLAMGVTAATLIYSPLGKRSGAHFNPAVTVTFFQLGKIDAVDALLYVIAQCVGGVAGMLVAATLFARFVTDPAVNYVVTVPGVLGSWGAFIAEVIISFVLMLVVLTVSNTARLARFTGLFAGALVATYITLEAPISGMSMNPARSLASALPACVWTGFWIYVLAPTLGMLLAAEIHARRSRAPVVCAKLHHDNDKRCIFRCGYTALAARKRG
jgi:aquaporin Z